jgi:hypothetical protein
LRSKSRIAAAHAAVVVSALCLACVQNTPLESAASTLVVHAVLNPSVRDQFVVVQRTVDGAPSAAAVPGATVTLTAPDGRVFTATELHDTTVARSTPGGPALKLVYRVSLDQYHASLVPGATYALRVGLPTGEEVIGTTTIPNTVATTEVPTPQAFDPGRDTLRLSWVRSTAVSVYEARVQSGVNVYATFADSNIALPGTLRTLDGKAVFASGLMHDVIVSAVDPNYYAYYRTNSDPFTGTPVVGNLTGAVGVFGSMVEVVVRKLDVRVSSAR